MQRKALAIVCKNAGAPSAEQLAAIGRYTLQDIPAEELYVRTFVVAHNAIDRDREVIDEALLAQMASTLPGKGMFVRHPGGWDGDSGPGEGRWFAARIERMSLDAAREMLRAPALSWPPDRTEAHVLLADAYMVRTDDNASMLRKMDAGVVGDVSIGFEHGGRTDIKTADGQLLAQRLNAPGEALEASLVWLGAQPGARAIKHATKDHVMTEEQLKALRAEHEAKLKALQDELATAQAAVGQLDNLRKALGVQQIDAAAIATAVSDGKAYRASLIDDIVAGERAKGMGIGDDEAAVAAHKALYQHADIDTLRKRAAAVADTASGRIKSGDPGGNRGAQPPATPAGLDSPALG